MTIFPEYSVIHASFVKFNSISQILALFSKLFNATKWSFFLKYINIAHFIIMVFTSCRNINYFSNRFRLSVIFREYYGKRAEWNKIRLAGFGIYETRLKIKNNNYLIISSYINKIVMEKCRLYHEIKMS